MFNIALNMREFPKYEHSLNMFQYPSFESSNNIGWTLSTRAHIGLLMLIINPIKWNIIFETCWQGNEWSFCYSSFNLCKIITVSYYLHLLILWKVQLMKFRSGWRKIIRPKYMSIAMVDVRYTVTLCRYWTGQSTSKTEILETLYS